jgi:hypothetical protein
MSTSGPTTRFAELVNAAGKLASDRVEQSSRAPRNRVADETIAAGSSARVWAGADLGDFDDPPEKTITRATAVAIVIAMPNSRPIN